jgi:putative Mn2+ efflux pump MntP
MNKEWYKSKTIWIAVAQGALGILIATTDVVPKEWVAVILFAKMGLDMIIRSLTAQPLGNNEPKTQ